ncbi:MAG: hypothetical protein ACXWQ5_23260 [Ktedonobacterales bacterium]
MTTYHRAARVDHPILTRCQHAQGDASRETCLYLHTLERIRDWTQHAEREYRDGEGRRAQIGELWVLSAELAYAHDNCPNGARLSEAILPKGSLHLRDALGLPVARS